MIQLQILSGSMAGVTWTARHFPVRVGRSTANDLRLEDPGVWDTHFTLDCEIPDGVTLSPQSAALVTVNHQAGSEVRLHNGDSIEAGSVKMRFWLATPPQRPLRLRELFIWALIAGITAGQLLLIYRFLP
ncbi:MAG: FHA domain-containing protein [Verrucomicrobia bacterium]|nr:MAG: FHA domain-containing protein [Verrucomicrobiota bacterium]